MTDIEKKALAWVNEVSGTAYPAMVSFRQHEVAAALCRAIEQHEAYKREVSDAVESRWMNILAMKCEDVFSRFIIPKPDPVKALFDYLETTENFYPPEFEGDIRAALAARGGRIVWEGE